MKKTINTINNIFSRLLIYLVRKNFDIPKIIKKNQIIFIIILMPIFITHIIDIFINFSGENVLLGFIFWIGIIISNIISLTSYLYFKNIQKITLKYINNLKTDNVICQWNDKKLKKGKIYKIQERNDTSYIIENNDFFLLKFELSTFKLISLKEQRKLKLEKLKKIK